MNYDVSPLVASLTARTGRMATVEDYARVHAWEQQAKNTEAYYAEKDRKSAVEYAAYEVEYRYLHQDYAFDPDEKVRDHHRGRWRSCDVLLRRYEQQFAGTPTHAKMREAAHKMDVKMRERRAHEDQMVNKRQKEADDRERVLAGLIAEKMRDMPGATREEALAAIADDRRQKKAEELAEWKRRAAEAEEACIRAQERDRAARRAAGPPTLRQRAAAYEAGWDDFNNKVAAYKRSLHEEAAAERARLDPEGVRAENASYEYFERRRSMLYEHERRLEEATLAHRPGSDLGWLDAMRADYDERCDRLEREHVQSLRGGCCG